MHEISRSIILEAQKEGIEQLFLKNPIIDSEKKKEIFTSIFGQFNPVTIIFIFFMRSWFLS